MATQKDKILGRIHAKPPGWVFSPKDFLDQASRSMISWLLHELTEEGRIRRIGRGLYFQPRFDDVLKTEIGPTHEQLAQAVARNRRWAILPHGATAANMLGLSQQVPATVVYLSNGPTTTIEAGDLRIQFRHAEPKELDFERYDSAIIVQALRHLGRANIEPWMIDHLRDRLPDEVKRSLLADTRYGAEWMFRLAQSIAEDSE